MHPNFKPKGQKPFIVQNQPRHFFEKRNFTKPEPMEVDKSSMHVNVGKPDKRPRSGEFSNQVGNNRKFPRLNQLDDDDDNREELDIHEVNVGTTLNEKEDTIEGIDDETASVFLDN